ncbi:MAG: hypothetical protein NDJ89_04625 [Oligoflexia bacterium]|nr:hypothetical protein [Oligoflexia bacterium]
MKSAFAWLSILGALNAAFAARARAIDFNMAPLEFSNRAACAELSRRPARSVFLMLDGFNAGKAGFARGAAMQKVRPLEEPKRWAQKSVTRFRLWSAQLSVDILESLLEGRLPLLPVDAAFPEGYRTAVESCLRENELLSCRAMNDWLGELWARAHLPRPDWAALGFSESDFFPKRLSENASIGCHVVRKFSAFHKPLATQKPDQSTVDSIAFDSFKPEEHLDSCFSPDDDADARFTTVQLDVADLASDEQWDAVGFRFWHTFKLFLSWGWRHAPEYQREFGDLRPVFASIAFEDSALLVPNGCRSVELPRCDSTGLSADALRAAKYLGQTHAAIREVPPKPIDILFDGRFQEVNNDVVGLLEADSADAWYRDFKEKLAALRLEMITKLNAGLAKLQVISHLLEPSALGRDIEALVDDPALDLNEAYLACMEYTLSKNQLFEDIDREIQTLRDAEELKSVLLADSSRRLGDHIGFYQHVAGRMQSFCKTLEARGQLASSVADLHKALHPWAFYLLHPAERSSYEGLCSKNPEHPVCPRNLEKRYLLATRKLSNGAQEQVAICRTPLECARTVLQSLVSVISVRRYARAFLPLGEAINSPDLLNTYSGQTACKLYDPWLKKRQAWKLFVADLGSAALYGAGCGAFQYAMLQPEVDKPVAYREVYRNHEVAYDILTKKEPARYQMGFDLQFLSGVSCGVTVSNALLDGVPAPSVFYGDFTVGACYGEDHTTYNVKVLVPGRPEPTEIDEKTSDKCFRCSFGVRSVVSKFCAMTPVGHAVAFGVGIFQGVLRLAANLSDSANIPAIETLNIDQISKSFEQEKGSWKRRCHDRARFGLSCGKKSGGQP